MVSSIFSIIASSCRPGGDYTLLGASSQEQIFKRMLETCCSDLLQCYIGLLRWYSRYRPPCWEILPSIGYSTPFLTLTAHSRTVEHQGCGDKNSSPGNTCIFWIISMKSANQTFSVLDPREVEYYGLTAITRWILFLWKPVLGISLNTKKVLWRMKIKSSSDVWN